MTDSLLAQLGRLVEESQDPSRLCQRVAEMLRGLTGCDRVALFFLSAEFPPFACDFTTSPETIPLPAHLGQAIRLRSVIESRAPRALAHRDLSDSPPLAEALLGSSGSAVLCVPLWCGGKPRGVVALTARDKAAVETWDHVAVGAVAQVLALAIDDLEAHARIAQMDRWQRETSFLRAELKAEHPLRLLTGESASMKAVRHAIQQVAATDSTVLILGETGTGKELVARAIHQLSSRRDHLLVSVNCGALAPGLVTSELFGHEPGAFTGATRRRLGRFELAQRGTIFLDEVGELPLEDQVLLLRVLQERALNRVGGNEAIPVDVRVIAATHQDLAAATEQGRFRADLFYRLHVFPIAVPPLRARSDDIPDLVRHFLHHFSRRLNKPVVDVDPATLQLLLAYSWPGNVRELENLVERAMIVTNSQTLHVEPSWLRASPASVSSRPTRLADIERQTILEALECCRGRIYGRDGAAALLGLKPTTLYGKMRKHGIKRQAEEIRDSAAGDR
jgi:formate hydrogenlyase transcriptional activator